MRLDLKCGAVLVGCVLFVGACGNDQSAQPTYEFDELYGATAGEQATRQLRLSESATRLAIECMNREGFTFDETDRGVASRQLVDRMQATTDNDEFVREFGYGITDTVVVSLLDLPEDPFSKARAQLDGAGQAAFDTAFAGPDGQGGCIAEAQKSALGGLLQLDARRIDLEEAIEDDSDFLSIEDEFVRCMRAAGYEATYFTWGRDQVLNRVVELQSQARVVLEDGSRVAFSEIAPGVVPESLELPEGLRVEVRAFELQVAEADYRCRKTVIDAYDEVRERHERDFLVENAELVERVYAEVNDE
ncbi:MAG: hypothetical protein OXN44_08910 [Acidimicrobiaceae bacterium]|nr:hypothetical protein [Acidimicrobiaceae bacterium]